MPLAIENYDGFVEDAKKKMHESEQAKKVSRPWMTQAPPTHRNNDTRSSLAPSTRAAHGIGLQEIDTQAEDLQRERGVPGWVMGYVGWAQRLTASTEEDARKRHAALVAKRGLYIAALQLLQKELEEQPALVTRDELTADWVALAGYEWATKVRRRGWVCGGAGCAAWQPQATVWRWWWWGGGAKAAWQH